jgi:hypothetical protein
MFALQILINDANLEPMLTANAAKGFNTRHTFNFQRYILGRSVKGFLGETPPYWILSSTSLQLVAKLDAHGAGVPGGTTASKYDVMISIFIPPSLQGI